MLHARASISLSLFVFFLRKNVTPTYLDNTSLPVTVGRYPTPTDVSMLQASASPSFSGGRRHSYLQDNKKKSVFLFVGEIV